MTARDLERAALRGEPSYVWRAGQDRRLEMILQGAQGRERGVVLDDGCGIGEFLIRLSERAQSAFGLEFDPVHVTSAGSRALKVVRAAAEALPYPDSVIDLVLSHEVLEHVRDDRRAMEEIVRVLRPPTPDSDAGRLVLFVPNRWYPFETHGIIWRGKYHFGNIPLVNYLPRSLRDRLAPHVRIYTRKDLKRLVAGLPLRVVHQSVIYGAYDNIIARWPVLGKSLRWILHWLERTPLRIFGLSHFWVLERKTGD